MLLSMALIVGISAMAQRVAPDVESPPGKSCSDQDCHGEYLIRLFLHQPTVRGKCIACHTYSGKKHEFQLAIPREALCTSCHTVHSGNSLHEPFVLGECDKCHDPHGSSHRHLLKKNPARELCFDCHEQEKIFPGAHRHEPAQIGACLVCHESHTSWNEKLLAQTGRDLCLLCHDETETRLHEERYIHEAFADECISCHDAHSSPSNKLLRGKAEELCFQCHDREPILSEKTSHRHGALTEEDTCLNCHLGHGSNFPKLLAHGGLELCLGCHDREMESEGGKILTNMALLFRENPVLHGPVARGDCMFCHNPHQSSNASLLVEPYPPEFYAPFSEDRYRLCFQCHIGNMVLEEATVVTRFRQGSRNLHFLHVNDNKKGRSCRACHEVHASRLPFHMREWVPFGPQNWRLEINYKLSPEGGSCTPGCHQTQEYNWSMKIPGGE